MKIARRFNAGKKPAGLVPEERLSSDRSRPSLRDLNRAVGNPAINRRAILMASVPDFGSAFDVAERHRRLQGVSHFVSRMNTK
ncbi:MAG: hypothetical protein ACI9VS_002765 [Candidatus Binatia bacterium]